jgi:hypothetical protein
MACNGTARADSGSSRTWLIQASSTACRRYTDGPLFRSSHFHRPAWETADSGSGRTRLIHTSSTACGRYTGVAAVSVQPLPIVQRGKRNFAGRDWRANSAKCAEQRPEFGSQTGYASLTGGDCWHFSHPGNPVGLPGLRGGGRSPAKPVSGGRIPCQQGKSRECFAFRALRFDFAVRKRRILLRFRAKFPNHRCREFSRMIFVGAGISDRRAGISLANRHAADSRQGNAFDE